MSPVEHVRLVVSGRRDGLLPAPLGPAAEGVIEAGEVSVEPPRRWLDGLHTPRIGASVRVDDTRTAALLDVESTGVP